MSDSDITLIRLADRTAWEAATAAHGLPSHSWHYAKGLSAEGIVPQLAIIKADGAQMIMPFHVRHWQGETDIATLPGLSGALIHPWDAPSAPLLEQWRAYAQTAGWVTGYIQLSPRNLPIKAALQDQISSHNALFEFDLTTWSFERDVQKRLRRYMRGLEKDGATVVTGNNRLLEAVLQLYPAAMARLGGESFGEAALRLWFDDPDLLLFGAEIDGQVKAVELCRFRSSHAEAHLTGTTEDGRGLHSWLLCKIAGWSADQGFQHFNIGGYGVSGDGLHAMKSKLGAVEHPLSSLRQIYRPDVYARLCQDSGADMQSPYFPAYRTKPQ